MYNDSKIDPKTNKPDIILDYNAKIDGMDTVDKMCLIYYVSGSRRWPPAVFFHLLNSAEIKSHFI